MESEDDIRNELAFVNKSGSNLPLKAVYMLGNIRNKTSLSLSVIFTFLQKIYQEIDDKKIPEGYQNMIDVALYKGEIGRAKELLENIQIIAQNEPIFEKPIEKADLLKCIKCFEEIPPKDCVFLDSCTHMFHQNCLTLYLEQNIRRNVLKISCPTCYIEIQPGFFQNFIDKDLMSFYEKNA